MQPYVVKQGDHLPLLAYQFGFDADAVWNDPANDDLRKQRPDPNLLLPTDVLYIPDQVDKPPATYSLQTGQTNSFVSDPPKVSLVVVFADTDRASQPFTVTEVPDLTGLSTDGDGCATFDVPITAQQISVVFASDGATFLVNVGHLDPIDTLSGAAQRLQNLGFLDPALDINGIEVDTVRAALQALQAGQSDDSGDDSSEGDADPPPSSGSDDGDALSDDPFADDAAGGDVTQYDDYAQDGSDSSPADSPPQSAQGAQDDPGMDDQGTPDDRAQKLLLDAHGS
jgi:hypothetical protein